MKVCPPTQKTLQQVLLLFLSAIHARICHFCPRQYCSLYKSRPCSATRWLHSSAISPLQRLLQRHGAKPFALPLTVRLSSLLRTASLMGWALEYPSSRPRGSVDRKLRKFVMAWKLWSSLVLATAPLFRSAGRPKTASREQEVVKAMVSRLCSASSNQDIVTTSVVNDDSRENTVDSMEDGGGNDHGDDSDLPSLEDIFSQTSAMATTTIPHSEWRMGHNGISKSGRLVGGRTDMQDRKPNIESPGGSRLGSSQGEHIVYLICLLIGVRTFGSHDRCRVPYHRGRPGRRQ